MSQGKVYLSGEVVSRSLPLTASDGSTIDAASATFSVTDTNENVALIASQTLTVNAGDQTLSYSVPATYNTLSSSSERFDGRIVTVEVTDTAGDVHCLLDRYIIRVSEPYIVGVDIPCTLIDSELAAYQSNIPEWFLLSDEQKEAALLKVFAVVKKLKFKVCGFNDDCPFLLSSITEDQYVNDLPWEFKSRIITAALLQAQFDAACTSYEGMRDAGLMSNSSGDSAIFFRSGKPVKYPLALSAWECLKGYVVYGSVKIARA